MSPQPIRPFADERVQHKTAVLNGHTYHYLYATPPSGKWSDTVFLVRLGFHLQPTVLPIFPPGLYSMLKKRPLRFTNGSTHNPHYPSLSFAHDHTNPTISISNTSTILTPDSSDPRLARPRHRLALPDPPPTQPRPPRRGARHDGLWRNGNFPPSTST
jgi:hypothetical protein